jgi:23S rRNA (uracil1939-C5)-methyltransferase
MKKSPYFPATAQIEKISPKGFGLGLFQKTEDGPQIKVVVPFAIPGDTAQVEVGPKRKRINFGKLLEILEPSNDRVEPKCSHVGACGGCTLQQMDYVKQLEYKESIIKELFGQSLPIVPAKSIWHYRNKMEYTFSQDREGTQFLGLIRAASRGRVEPLKECFLSPPWFVDVLKEVRAWWESGELLAFNGFRNSGSLRTLTLREGKRTEQKMAILTVSGVPEFSLNKEQITSFANSVKKGLPDTLEENLSIFLRVQQTAPGMVTQFYEMELSGPAHIQEELTITVGEYTRDYKFKISPTAFFQPNTAQAEEIYSKALELAGMRKRKRVLDLYAGTATLGMVFAPFTEKVIAIEINPYAVFDAEMNKESNQIENLQLYKGDVAEVLFALKKSDPSMKNPELALLDPPRVGLSKEALEIVIDLQPEEIIYISCSPASQARDCSALQEAGYQIIEVQPVDQFPHTVHIENIILLRR